MKTTERLAFDRASVRSFDGNGRLQVKLSNISKANVCPYFGREIPGAEKLGLEPDKIYRLWRHPDELKKAAATFNNIPLLSIHTPDFPGDPPREYRVGVTHSNADFDGTYLTNGLSVWDDSAIAGIETEEQEELSSSYQYVADMTPGVTPNGEPYDGIMRDIIGNHVALVEKGRAGSDVLVADSLPPELKQMARAKNILDALKPFLAADADLKEVEEKVKDKLDEEDEKREEDDLKKKAEREKEEAEKLKKETADDEDDEDGDDKKKNPAEDEDDEDDKKDDKVSKTAMDSAIRLAADSATKRAAENFRKVREAEQAVRPLIGDVVAMDSADDVYRTALEQAGVDIEGVHPSAFPKMVKMAIEQQNNKRPVIAQDSASHSEFEKAFPTAGKLKRGF
ncbi:DUF2213 domain-containing protein [Enterobacter asburiae]|uniref:DUF2213 domain-containing protein n=1 Tax=Enterobacter asburiae TaxID=61645 RepID=UPI0020760B49|nr:DUF2213 domain-containing protein [Enterobacter asburiae]MCM6996533.1 DUF2213 domain-containing protein [Enterobacter asburiae]